MVTSSRSGSTDPADLERAAALVAPFGSTPPRLNVDLKQISLPVKGSAKVLIAAGRALDDHGIALEDLGIRRPSLDDVFLSFTGHPTASDGRAESGDTEGGTMSDLAVQRLSAEPPP